MLLKIRWLALVRAIRSFWGPSLHGTTLPDALGYCRMFWAKSSPRLVPFFTANFENIVHIFRMVFIVLVTYQSSSSTVWPIPYIQIHAFHLSIYLFVLLLCRLLYRLDQRAFYKSYRSGALPKVRISLFDEHRLRPIRYIESKVRIFKSVETLSSLFWDFDCIVAFSLWYATP